MLSFVLTSSAEFAEAPLARDYRSERAAWEPGKGENLSRPGKMKFYLSRG
jgi:hypothetical protein